MDNRLKQLRSEKQLTMQEVADYVGVNVATVSRWENGEIANMRRDKVAKLAELFNVRPSYILGMTDTQEFSHDDRKQAINFIDNVDLIQVLAEASRLSPSDQELVKGQLQFLVGRLGKTGSGEPNGPRNLFEERTPGKKDNK